MAGSLTIDNINGKVISSSPVATESQVIGVGQTWQNVKQSRALLTTYTNTTGKPIMVGVSCYSAGAANSVLPIVNGIPLADGADYGTGGVYFIVPNGATYYINSGETLQRWVELR